MAEVKIVTWFDDHWLPTYTRGVKKGFDKLSHRDRVLALVGAEFDYQVGAGWRVMYAGPVGAHTAELADAFAVIGCEPAARVIRRFAAMFPGSAPSADAKERERQVAELPDEAWEVLDEIGELFEECAEDGERVLLQQLYDWYHAQAPEADN